MNIISLKDQAVSLGLDSRIITGPTRSLVRSIQKAQGHEPCFLTDKRLDCKESCDYRTDCRRLTAAWLR